MLEYDANSHEYRVDGAIVPHVTAITDTLIDFGGIAPDVLEHARDRGTAVHLLTELHDRGELDEDALADELRGYLTAYRRFIAEADPQWDAIEQRVYSARYRYAGTLDRVGSIGGKRSRKGVLVDIKATASIQPAVGPQTAAYAHAYGDSRLARFALQLRPDGTYRFHECRDQSDLPVFLAAMTVYNWRRNQCK
jgi:hypothetical protein